MIVPTKFEDRGPGEFDQYILDKWEIKPDIDQQTGMKVINVTMTLTRKIVNVFMVKYHFEGEKTFFKTLISGDLSADNSNEHDQPGDQLYQRRGQVQHDLHHQHHLHDGPGQRLPLGVRQLAHHLGNQASGGLADLQPRLPLHYYSGQRPATGLNVFKLVSCK